VAVVKASQLIPCSTTSQADRLIPTLSEFVRNVINSTQTLPVTLFAAMILLDRLKTQLPGRAYGSAETCHRVFMAALILANKLLFDVPIKNQIWSECSSIYSLDEINLMEKQFLSLLAFKLHLNEEMLWHQIVFVMNHPSAGLQAKGHHINHYANTPNSYSSSMTANDYYHYGWQSSDNSPQYLDWNQGIKSSSSFYNDAVNHIKQQDSYYGYQKSSVPSLMGFAYPSRQTLLC
jgi:hypothetical protein